MTEWFLFFLVVFVYVHVIQQYKYSEESEVYEMDYVDNANLQETCQLLQPVVFVASLNVLPVLPMPEDYAPPATGPAPTLALYDATSTKYATPLPFAAAWELLGATESLRYSEHNEAWIAANPEYQEKLHEMHAYLQPPLTVQSSQDVCIGALQAYTPFRYHVNTRKFLVVVSGRITVKMAPWKKHAKCLHEVRDYELGEYRSNMNVWEPKEHHRRDHDKIEFLEFDVDVGHILYVPPYWGYSVRYQEPRTVLVDYTYSSLFNRLAFLGEIGRTWMQQQRIFSSYFPSVRPRSMTPIPAQPKPDPPSSEGEEPPPPPPPAHPDEKKEATPLSHPPEADPPVTDKSS
jgi:hypothetical protein